MKTFVGLFLSSALFSCSIAVVYWFSSEDYAGTLLLGFMTIALTFAASFAMIKDRSAKLAGDSPEMQHKQAAGDDLGIFTKNSAWPPLLALSICVLLIGVVWSDFLIFVGAAAMLLILWRLGAESSRVSQRWIEKEDGSQTLT